MMDARSDPAARVAVPTEVYLPGGGVVPLPRRVRRRAAVPPVSTLRALMGAPTDEEKELADRFTQIESDLDSESARLATAEEAAAELEKVLARLVEERASRTA